MALDFISDYKTDDVLRKSFNQLAKHTFGIEFEKWYQAGCWEDNYKCYSYKDEDEVVVNLSTTNLTMMVNHRLFNAVQVGTVMTHPDYRGKGHNSALMRKALDEHKEADLFFLFADKDAIAYYEKYGFKAYRQYDYMLDLAVSKGDKLDQVVDLDMNKACDRERVITYYEARRPSETYDTFDAGSILMWYCVNFYNGHIKYIEALDTIVISECDEETLDLVTVLSKEAYELDELLPYIVTESIKVISFGFTPVDDQSYTRTLNEEAIYIRSDIAFSEFERYPTIATA